MGSMVLTTRQLDYLRKRKQRKFRLQFLSQVALFEFFLLTICVLIALSGSQTDDSRVPLAILAFLGLNVLGLGYFSMVFRGDLGDPPPRYFESFGFYLRPFKEDARAFEINEGSNAVGELMSGRMEDGSKRNFDTFAASALGLAGYPLLAIGDPRDRAPKKGSYKFYPSDFCWKFFVRRLTAKSHFVLIRCLDAKSFEWELTLLASNIHKIRLLLFIGLEDSDEAIWPLARKVLLSAGYAVPEPFPGRGCLLHFRGLDDVEKAGKMISSESEFAEAIKKTLLSEGAEVAASATTVAVPAPVPVELLPTSEPVTSGSVDQLQPAIPKAAAVWKEAETAAVAPEQRDRYYAKLWRKQFLNNPFVLGPPGLLMLLYSLLHAAASFYAVLYLALATNVYAKLGSYRLGSLLTVAGLFILFFLILRIVSGSCVKWTERWAARKGKTLDEVFKKA